MTVVQGVREQIALIVMSMSILGGVVVTTKRRH